MNSTDNYTKVNKIEDEKGFDIAEIPFILHKQYISHHTVELSSLLQATSSYRVREEIREIKKLLKPFIDSNQKYLKTDQAAKFIGVSVSFLQKNRDIYFQKGIHYFIPHNDARLVRWDKEALEQWIEGEVYSDEDKTLISKLLD